MAKRKRKSPFRFFGGMMVYAMIVIVITLIGMRLMWNFMAAYERSRPNNTMDAYVQSFDTAKIRAVAGDTLSQLDGNIQTEDQGLDVVRELFNGNLKYAKKSAESSENKTVYVISCNGKELGTVVLTKEEDPAFGFSPWSVAEEDFDFTSLMEDYSVTVPDDWSVVVNGKALGEEYVTASQIPYALLEEFYDEEDVDMPHMCTYHFDSFVGDPVVSFKNAAGETVNYDGQVSEQLFLDNCSADEKADIDEFVDNFIKYYIQFNTNSNRQIQGNYAILQEYMVKDSPLDIRMRGAFEALTWAHGGKNDITSITKNAYTKLDGDYYFVDVTYIIEITGHADPVVTTNNAKILILETDGRLRAAAMTSY